MARACVSRMLIVAGLLGAAPAWALGHFEFGVGGRVLFGSGDFTDVAGSGLGVDFVGNWARETGGPAIRGVLAMHHLASSDYVTSGTFLFEPITGTYETTQQVAWCGIGPAWDFDRPGGRAEVYVLAARGNVSATGSGVRINVEGDDPEGGAMWFAVAGASFEARPASGGPGLAFGAEFVRGGRATVWDSPAVTAVEGGWVQRTRETTVRGFVLRAGLVFHRLPRR